MWLVPDQPGGPTRGRPGGGRPGGQSPRLVPRLVNPCRTLGVTSCQKLNNRKKVWMRCGAFLPARRVSLCWRKNRAAQNCGSSRTNQGAQPGAGQGDSPRGWYPTRGTVPAAGTEIYSGGTKRICRQFFLFHVQPGGQSPRLVQQKMQQLGKSLQDIGRYVVPEIEQQEKSMDEMRGFSSSQAGVLVLEKE